MVSKTLTSVDRFDKVDEQFLDMKKQLEGMNKQLDKIVTVVVKGFDRIDKVLEEKADKADLRRVFDLLNKIYKQQEIDNDERLVMGH